MIESANDKSVSALRIKVRLEYCQQMFPLTDPIEVRYMRIDVLDSMLDDLPAPPLMTNVRRERDADDNDGAHAQRRRRLSSLSSLSSLSPSPGPTPVVQH
jgi:hypothetical protein